MRASLSPRFKFWYIYALVAALVGASLLILTVTGVLPAAIFLFAACLGLSGALMLCLRGSDLVRYCNADKIDMEASGNFSRYQFNWKNAKEVYSALTTKGKFKFCLYFLMIAAAITLTTIGFATGVGFIAASVGMLLLALPTGLPKLGDWYLETKFPPSEGILPIHNGLDNSRVANSAAVINMLPASGVNNHLAPRTVDTPLYNYKGTAYRLGDGVNPASLAQQSHPKVAHQIIR